MEHRNASAPTHRDPDAEWVDCNIPIDAREAAGVTNRRAQLR